MGIINNGLIKKFFVDAAVAAYRFVKFGTDDDHVAQSAAATDLSIGVSDSMGADAAEDSLDVVIDGAAEIEAGGTITRGQRVVPDSDGKAVAATPASIVQTIIAGGAAGAHVVTGIETTDTLLAVIEIDATDASETFADLTSEFTISDDDEIDNAAGTTTTGSGLLVTYRKALKRSPGIAAQSMASGDIGSVILAPADI